MEFSRLDYATAGVGILVAAAFFPIFFDGLAGFWEDFTEYGGYRQWSWGNLKIVAWVMLAGLSAWSAHGKLPQWFPNFFH